MRLILHLWLACVPVLAIARVVESRSFDPTSFKRTLRKRFCDWKLLVRNSHARCGERAMRAKHASAKREPSKRLHNKWHAKNFDRERDTTQQLGFSYAADFFRRGRLLAGCVLKL